MQRLRASTPAERQAAAVEIASQLGADWKADPVVSAEESLSLVHLPTAIAFIAVPGGRFDMGLSEEDIEEASEYIDWVSYVADRVDELAARSRPVRRVHVRPFLVARRPLQEVDAKRLGATGQGDPIFLRAEARELPRTRGFRLVSEAEFEWLARDGGEHRFFLDAARATPPRRDAALRSRFGVVGLSKPHWVEDDWHATYDGAPSDASPWMNGGSQGVRRGGFVLDTMQDEQELLDAFAAARYEGDGTPCVVRFAMDIL